MRALGAVTLELLQKFDMERQSREHCILPQHCGAGLTSSLTTLLKHVLGKEFPVASLGVGGDDF
jgi:hypothetical protein